MGESRCVPAVTSCHVLMGLSAALLPALQGSISSWNSVHPHSPTQQRLRSLHHPPVLHGAMLG